MCRDKSEAKIQICFKCHLTQWKQRSLGHFSHCYYCWCDIKCASFNKTCCLDLLNRNKILWCRVVFVCRFGSQISRFRICQICSDVTAFCWYAVSKQNATLIATSTLFLLTWPTIFVVSAHWICFYSRTNMRLYSVVGVLYLIVHIWCLYLSSLLLSVSIRSRYLSIAAAPCCRCPAVNASSIASRADGGRSANMLNVDRIMWRWNIFPLRKVRLVV